MFSFLDQAPWLLPFIIFFGRIIDVSLGTLRIIFVSKGEKYKAPIIGFFEVLIWIVVISEIFSRANDFIAYLSYAGGYATGNFVGILIEQKIAYLYYELDNLEVPKKALSSVFMPLIEQKRCFYHTKKQRNFLCLSN